MKRIFDFRFAGKKTMPVRLPPDGKELSLIVPDKATCEEFYARYANIEERCNAAETEEQLDAITDECYDAAAMLLSANTDEMKFTGPALKDMGFPFEALFPFFVCWADFIDEVENSKN